MDIRVSFICWNKEGGRSRKKEEEKGKGGRNGIKIWGRGGRNRRIWMFLNKGVYF